MEIVHIYYETAVFEDSCSRGVHIDTVPQSYYYYVTGFELINPEIFLLVKEVHFM